MLRLVARRLDPSVTVNVFEGELDPWVALTICSPLDDSGTAKVAENPPLLLVVTEEGSVVTTLPPKVMVTVELGENPEPVIFTGVPTGPDVELSIMVGVTVDVTVNVFEGELVPSVPITV